MTLLIIVLGVIGLWIYAKHLLATEEPTDPWRGIANLATD